MRTQPITARLALCAALGCPALGCGGLDSADKVHDLRLLAMRADPPQQVFYVSLQNLPSNAATLSGAGGLSGYGGGGPRPVDPPDATTGGGPGRHVEPSGRDANTSTTGGTGSAGFTLPLVEPITTTALIADPQLADGGAIHYAFATCTSLDSDTGQCLPSSPDYQVLKEGFFEPTDGQTWGEVSATLTPSPTFLLDAIENDPYRGFGGLPIITQVSLSYGSESVVGIKRSTLLAWQSLPLPPADVNPVIPAVTVAGIVWPGDEVLWFSDPYVDFQVIPEAVPDLEVSYQVPKFDGTTLTFKESWDYEFFCTAGGFSPGFSGGVDAAGDVNPVNTDWGPPDSLAPQLVTYWIVVQDGRGGESWIVRRALWAPQPTANPLGTPPEGVDGGS